MEIYRNSVSPRVTLTVPDNIVPIGDTVDIKAVDNMGETLHVFEEVIRTNDGFAVELPWSLTREDDEFFIDWNFQYNEGLVVQSVHETSQVQIVSAILPYEEVARITGWTDPLEINDLERRVRYSIQTYTATTFGRFRGTIPVQGSDDSKLTLPLPLLELESPTGLTIYGGGTILGSAAQVYDGGIKSAPPDYVLDQYYTSGVPIKAPGYFSRFHFRDDVMYNIKGLWGYHDIPGDVRQAARLLIADYACDESLWRDRYVNAIKAGDWRIDFNAAAFTGTGNVSADQILAQYRRLNMAAI